MSAPMLECAQCRNALSRESFSKSQAKQGVKRRCKACVDGGKTFSAPEALESQAKPPSQPPREDNIGTTASQEQQEPETPRLGEGGAAVDESNAQLETTNLEKEEQMEKKKETEEQEQQALLAEIEKKEAEAAAELEAAAKKKAEAEEAARKKQEEAEQERQRQASDSRAKTEAETARREREEQEEQERRERREAEARASEEAAAAAAKCAAQQQASSSVELEDRTSAAAEAKEEQAAAAAEAAEAAAAAAAALAAPGRGLTGEVGGDAVAAQAIELGLSGTSGAGVSPSARVPGASDADRPRGFSLGQMPALRSPVAKPTLGMRMEMALKRLSRRVRCT